MTYAALSAFRAYCSTASETARILATHSHLNTANYCWIMLIVIFLLTLYDTITLYRWRPLSSRLSAVSSRSELASAAPAVRDHVCVVRTRKKGPDCDSHTRLGSLTVSRWHNKHRAGRRSRRVKASRASRGDDLSLPTTTRAHTNSAAHTQVCGCALLDPSGGHSLPSTD